MIHSDVADYWTGTLSAMWAEMLKNEYDVDNQFQYREKFYDWLNNGKAKILKLDDGREWIINITDSIQESANDHWKKVITTFDWTEIGQHNDAYDLYTSGLIDVNPDIYLNTR